MGGLKGIRETVIFIRPAEKQAYFRARIISSQTSSISPTMP